MQYTQTGDRDIFLLFSIRPFARLFSLFKQLNRQGYCVLLFSFWERKSLMASNSSWNSSSSRWTQSWLQMAANTLLQQKSRMKNDKSSECGIQFHLSPAHRGSGEY